MNLSRVKSFFETVSSASALDVAEHFATSVQEIKCYIEHLEIKGCIKKKSNIRSCEKSCNLCKPNFNSYYEWIE